MRTVPWKMIDLQYIQEHDHKSPLQSLNHGRVRQDEKLDTNNIRVFSLERKPK
jgi:hypothetical protein